MNAFAERDVPADVRDRITETVHRGMAEPAPRGLRTPLAVAAAVILLAVAGVVVAVARHDRTAQPAKPPHSAAADEIDRCWHAVVAGGRQRDFPVRAQWMTVHRQASTSANVTALRADGKTFFCMTTPATVTVTDPNAEITPVAGTSIRVALADDNGWVAGTAPGNEVSVERNGAIFSGLQPGGVFLIHVDAERDLASRVRLMSGTSAEELRIPSVPAPAVERTDRPLPAPDRASKAGRQLGACIDEAGWPKSYADQWQPGAYAEFGQWYVVAATTAGGQYGICFHAPPSASSDGRYHFIPMNPVPASAKPQFFGAESSIYGDLGDRELVVGSVPTGAATVTVWAQSGRLAADVRGGLWAAVVPMPIDSVVIEDARGNVLYDGPPELVTK